MLGSYRFIDEECRDNVFVKPFSWNVQSPSASVENPTVK